MGSSVGSELSLEGSIVGEDSSDSGTSVGELVGSGGSASYEGAGVSSSLSDGGGFGDGGEVGSLVGSSVGSGGFGDGGEVGLLVGSSVDSIGLCDGGEVGLGVSRSGSFVGSLVGCPVLGVGVGSALGSMVCACPWWEHTVMSSRSDANTNARLSLLFARRLLQLFASLCSCIFAVIFTQKTLGSA